VLSKVARVNPVASTTHANCECQEPGKWQLASVTQSMQVVQQACKLETLETRHVACGQLSGLSHS
jgi:hypothetical protein